jgi:hypothetical protein
MARAAGHGCGGGSPRFSASSPPGAPPCTDPAEDEVGEQVAPTRGFLCADLHRAALRLPSPPRELQELCRRDPQAEEDEEAVTALLSPCCRRSRAVALPSPCRCAQKRGAGRRRWGGRRCGPTGSGCRSSAGWRRWRARRAVVEGGGWATAPRGSKRLEGKRKGERGWDRGKGGVVKKFNKWVLRGCLLVWSMMYRG